MTTRVVIADDHPLVLQALDGLLRSQPDMEVVGACRGGLAAVDLVQKVSPDILVLDISMPVVDGIDVLERLGAENNSTRVIVFTGNMDERRALECLRLGVSGVVLKESPPEMLLQAIRKVAAGDVWLEKRSHTQAVSLMLRQEEAKKRLAAQLTGRELEIFGVVAQGLRNRDIAERLHVTEGTVKLHLHHIFNKLELRGRADLIRYAHESEIV